MLCVRYVCVCVCVCAGNLFMQLIRMNLEVLPGSDHVACQCLTMKATNDALIHFLSAKSIYKNYYV